MAIPRFYAPDVSTPGEHLALSPDTSHHMIHVLRMKVGDSIVLFHGRGGEFAAEIIELTRKTVTVQVNSFDDVNRGGRLQIELGLCVIKKDAMDRAIGRAVELGVNSIAPLISDNCTVNRRMIQQRQHHWQQVAVSACEQCGLNLLPEVKASVTLRDWLDTVEADLKLVCEPGDVTSPVLTGEPVSGALLIGPEGGLTADELQDARSSGFRALSLGPRILRAETAPLVALSILNNMP